MSQLIQDDTNVINLDFRREQMNIEHPASKRFEDIDDPLEDLLNEFSYLDEKEPVAQRDYIAHLEVREQQSLSARETSLSMSEKLITKMQQAQESMNRLKYYIDELDLES